MPTGRIATVTPVPEEAATGKVAEVYADIRRTLATRHVFSFFRVLSPFPAYLGSVWLESKKLLNESPFQRARDELTKRTVSLLVGLPVRDHRGQGKRIAPEDWRSVEQLIDDSARLLPQMALVASVWRKSFATAYQIIAAPSAPTLPIHGPRGDITREVTPVAGVWGSPPS